VKKRGFKNSIYSTISLAQCFADVCSSLKHGSSALVSHDGRYLYVESRRSLDSASLPHSAVSTLSYLKLGPGDVAIGNDPFSGGTHLGDLHLVKALRLSPTAQNTEVLLAYRISFGNHFSIDGKLDEEGLRIPPMPLLTRGQLNRDLLQMMAAAPLAPHGLIDRVQTALSEMDQAEIQLQRSLQRIGLDFQKLNIKKYLQDCRDAFAAQISTLPLGECIVSTALESGEIIKLRLEVEDEKISFDFTGTEASSRLQLTDLMTFGACLSAVEAVLDRSVIKNSGSFSRLDVFTPSRTLVNAQAPAATARGAHEGVDLISSLVLQAFGKLHRRTRFGASGVTLQGLKIEFSDGRVYHERLPGGSGGRAEVAGVTGDDFWSREPWAMIHSTEKTEQNFALKVKSIVNRVGSSGKGQWPGGMGLIKSYVLQAPAKLSWSLEQSRLKPEGQDGGKAGLGSEIVVIKNGQTEKLEQPAFGTLNLDMGDTIIVYSPGGGGFAEPKASS